MGPLIALNPNRYVEHKSPKEGTLTSGRATTCHREKNMHKKEPDVNRVTQSNNYKNCKNWTQRATKHKSPKAEGGGVWETCPIGNSGSWKFERTQSAGLSQDS